jgi:lysophospholipase D
MKEKGKQFSHHFIAHRGGGWHAPENTLQAFKRAVDRGCHMLEMDVRMTKDKHIIVCHDLNLKRLCGVDKKVSEFNLKDLPKFQKKMPMHFAETLKTGDYLSYERQQTDQDSFSLLEDIFKAFPDVNICVEVKDKGNEEAARKTIELIQKYNRHHLTLCASDEAWWTRRMLEMDPRLGTVFGNTDVIKLYFFCWFGLLPFL